MATRAFLIGTLLFIVGCQSQQVVETLPAPNFNGPNVVAAPVAEVAPVVPVPPAAKPTPFVGNVPKAWIPLAGYKRDWYYIVIHHSASPSGSLAVFDREHREKGWDECGYDFVIGNGTNSGNGQIEVGTRWPVQKYGAHDKTPDERYNEHGIGICLVGNFDIDRPSAAQMASLTKLVVYLMKTYHISAANIYGHGDTKKTRCPGTNLNVIHFRSTIAQKLADAGESVPDEFAQPITASAELLQDQFTPVAH